MERREEKIRSPGYAKQIQLALAAANIGLWTWDISTNEVRFSEVWKAQLGYEPNELEETFATWEERLHPDDRALVLRRLRAYVDDPWPEYETEFRLRHRNGEYRWFLARADLERDDKGRPAIMRGCHIDITERKEDEEELRRLAVAVRASGTGVWMRDLEGDGAYHSPEWAAMLGYRADEIADSNDEFVSRLHPEDLERMEDIDAVARRDPSKQFEWRFRLRHMDGAYRWFLSRGERLRGADNRDRLYGCLIDITEQTESEQAARANEEILQRIFDRVPVMICFIDAAGGIQLANREFERLLGWGLEELRADPLIFEKFYPDPEYRAKVLAFIARGTGHWGEFRTTTRNGRVIDTAFSNVLLSDGTSIGIGRDISEEKETARRVRRMRRRLRDTEDGERRRIAGELHDQAGQTLTALGVSLELVKSRLGAEAPDEVLERLEQAMELVAQTGGQIRQLINDLRPPALDDYGLAAALRTHAETFGRSTGLEVEVRGETGHLDPGLETALFRIAQEALTNTVRHASAKSAQITLERTEREVCLEIVDDGVGFDVDIHRTSDEGSIGLHLMYERATAVAGSLQLESQPGQGTRILVRAPL